MVSRADSIESMPTERMAVLQHQGGTPGQVVAGKYRLITEIGRGGMGVVWRGERLAHQAWPVAIKLMAPSLQGFALARKRFEREVCLAALVRGPHVVQVFDHGLDDKTGELYIVMELLDGASVGRRLQHLTRLDPGEVMLLVKQVASALTSIHKAGVVHRDLKPDNIFLIGNDDEPVFKILDFGLAKQVGLELSDSLDWVIDSRALTTKGNAVGTPWYMSPEHLRGEQPEPRGDLWSLAIIACECLVGRRPFDATDIPTLGAQLLAAARPVPSQLGDVPAGFDAWFAKATHPDPDQRFQTAKELETALHAVCGATAWVIPTIQGQPRAPTRAHSLAGVTRPPESPPALLRRRATAAVLVATLAGGLGVSAYMLSPGSSPQSAHALETARDADRRLPPPEQTASATRQTTIVHPLTPSAPTPLAPPDPAPPFTDSAVTATTPVAPTQEPQRTARMPSPKRPAPAAKKPRRASPSVAPRPLPAPQDDVADRPSIVRDY
jgi:eukaryotic-like serine/threonine-protein kinase